MQNTKKRGKRFSLEAIISVMHGYLMPDAKGIEKTCMTEIYQILNFMCGDDLFTHQLPRARREVEPYLKEWLPKIAALNPDKWNYKNEDSEHHVSKKLENIKLLLGDSFVVWQIPRDDHEIKDPIQEVIDMGFGDKLITIDLSEDDSISPYGDLSPHS